MAEPENDDGSLKTTPPMALAVAALFGGLAAWLIVVVAGAVNISPPQVPWTAPVAVIVIAVGVAIVAWTTYQRIHRRRQRLEPQRAVSFLVLGKASALAGALIAGGYLVYGLLFIGRIDGESPRERVVLSVIAVIGGIGLSAAGMLLERACKLPKDDPDSDANQRDDSAGTE